MLPEPVDMLLKIPEEKRWKCYANMRKILIRLRGESRCVAENCKLLRYARFFRCSEFNFHAIGGKDRPDTFDLQMG